MRGAPEDNYDPSLPERCYYQHPVDGQLILLARGYRGYFTPSDFTLTARERNEAAGVNQLMADCMWAGCSLGWDHPSANLTTVVARSFRRR